MVKSDYLVTATKYQHQTGGEIDFVFTSGLWLEPAGGDIHFHPQVQFNAAVARSNPPLIRSSGDDALGKI